jgi:hypothetical protein
VSFHPHCGAPFTSKNASLRTCEPYQGNHWCELDWITVPSKIHLDEIGQW